MSDQQDDEIFDQIMEEGEIVFSHAWDSGGPGAGAGCEQVYHWKGKFFICSLDMGNFGPFASLDEALQDQDMYLLSVNSATTSIHCSLMKAEELAKRLQCEEDECTIDINGEPWTYRLEDGEFKRNRNTK